MVEIDTLLDFEPFAKLGELVLFEEDDSDVQDEFIARLANRVHDQTFQYMKVLGTSAISLDNLLNNVPRGETSKLMSVFRLWRQHGSSYCNLCKALSDFSVYAGRNPFELY